MITLNPEDIKSKIAGKVILPGDTEYDQASSTLFRKGTPAIIVRPSTGHDVALAIKYARDQKLAIAVRGGGHSNEGYGTNNGGLVIDLSAMNSVELVKPDVHVVRVGPGATWGQVAKTLHKHGLSITSGDTASVGVGGLTLGGGVGWMVRKYGLTIDSLQSADVVTADGKTLHTSATENKDLFWAIRGGGGNFGVVISFEFKAHPITKVYAGSITYGTENLADLLKGWRDHMRKANDDLTTMFLVMPQFGDNPPAAIILCCYASDDHAAAMQALEPLQKLGQVTHQDIRLKNYAEVLEEAHVPPGVKIIVNNTFVQDFSDQLINTIVGEYNNNHVMLQIRSVGAAMNRVQPDATAFAHRDSEALIVNPTFLPLNASPEQTAKALEPWHKIAAYGKGSYVNLLGYPLPEVADAAYPMPTLERLRKIKTMFDPQNVFAQNHNFKPNKAS